MMLKSWSKDGKQGKYMFSEGKVVYRRLKCRVNIEPFYVEGVPYQTGARYYLDDSGKLQETFFNPFSGCFYRQDGK